MRSVLLFVLLLFTCLILPAEEIDSLQNKEPETVETAELDINNEESTEDVFIDENGDGIADDRTFRERMRKWRRTRTMSDRILTPGNGNSEGSGKFGNKAKKGGQEGNNGNNQGNGNGNG